ncbi:phosphatidylinositol 4,5-bisphosphate 5-phosphatase A [Aquila chrysaetos chrysaetos]|uniref:phosphatidylinositol 4,5-bisphosphate 5-phosphatase A n=1 Tax=Aquila chrysaetos chrysaetos TaxID=223781 RepID=UPI0011772171|nr:phosphatidylinositol 4,5-bisphosphate 5-phosphatase A [Aquila chrysaetos chrysaetos]
MEPARRGSADQGSAAASGHRPGPPRGSASAASPARPVPFGGGGPARPQPDGGAPAAPFLAGGGGVPGARRSSRPDAACDPFPYGCPRPGGAQRGGPEERAPGRAAQPLPLEVGRAGAEGAGGPHAFPLPALLPPSPGAPPARPAVPSPAASGPAAGRPAFPELGPLEHAAPGKPVPAERREMLPKAESSDHISAWAGSSPRAAGLPKAVSSEFIAGGRVGLSKPAALPKPEPDELSLFGRSLGLPGSGDSCDALLGCSGRVPEDGSFRITVVTWNVGTAMPPNDVTSLLHLNTGETNDVDVIAIGLQEVNSKINKRLKDALFTDQWSELFMDVLSPFHFVLISTVRMQGVILLVFAKYYHLPFLQDIQTDCTRTGLGGYWGNKGGVSVRLSIFGHMVCFLNCHLPAHLEKAEQRKEDFATILHMQQFEGRAASGILDHDLVFWFGDLNFRIESLDIRFVKYAIDSNILSQLWEKDQLNIAKSTWPVLSGFQEGPLNFPPTFKFDVGTNKYDSSAKKRKPAWTDRILWKIKSPSVGLGAGGRRPSRGVLSVSQLCYCSHMEYTVSDHKPVAAIFAVQFASKADKPPVEIYVADEWSRPEQAVVRYKMSAGFHRSSWDWIGLYRVGFRHPKDYVSYVWARSDDGERCLDKQLCAQVMFSEEALPKGKGEYILGYYSNTSSSIAGVTEPFQISLPRSEEGSSPTDSSGSSSEEEDDSTLVLLAPKSRSPSPGKMKRHRSRSPSLAKFQGLILRPSSRDRGTSRSPSPQSRRGLPGDIPTIHLPQEELGRRGAKAKEPGRAADSQEGSSFYQTVREQGGPRRVSADNPLARADPRNLGLLPALRLEMIDQAMGRRRESTDQGYPCRRMSPTSPPGCSTSPKEGSSPQELDSHSCAMGR